MVPQGGWRDRTLVALTSVPDPGGPTDVVQEVAVRFADRFGPLDKQYVGERPRWHREVLAALAQLRQDGLVEAEPGSGLTAAGTAESEGARDRLAREPTPAEQHGTDGGAAPATGAAGDPGLLVAGVITPPLRTTDDRRRTALSDADDEALPVMVELNLTYRGGPAAAFGLLERLWRRVTGRDGPVRLADEYATGALTMNELKRLVAADSAPVTWTERSIYRVWPDFQVHRQVDATAVTIKADAARRSFNCYGEGIVWAVVDSGIDGAHPHFRGDHTLDDPAVSDLHRVFPGTGVPTGEGALVDEDGHGTHVAGIIAGGLAQWPGEPGTVVVTENRYNVDNPAEPLRQPRVLSDAKGSLAGMAPRAKLVSLKVLGGGGPLESRVSRVIQALAYVREVNAASDKLLRIHGVNLSVGYEFDPAWFACGRSPLCQEVDKLVRTGVVVVVAAGNSGYGTLDAQLSGVTRFSLDMTINDPGNAERAITVGSTHRDMPHAYGVSYFSSKGPTGDGRRKPDLVAPGERITSAAAGRNRAAVLLPDDLRDPAVYVEDSGTSMAAPHVSGVIAAFLSVRKEFIGRPDEVKRIFLGSATPLGRDPNFEGAGLVDLMRALQSV
jgi:serine protease AprX